MKKIILSVSIIAIVATIAIGVTVALFNDTETSAGNIFVAGTLDLKVDNGKAYYDGMYCNGGTWQCEPWADYVVDFDQGVRKNGTPVLLERSDPTQALGVAQNNDTVNFVSLGFTTGIDGYIVLGYTNKILNGSGNDLKVVETSYGNPSESQYPEKAKVYVSQDGINWSYLGIAALDEEFDMDNGKLASDETTLFVLDWAKFVKLQDVSDKTSPNFPNDTDGFDVDGVQALHCEADPNLIGQSCNGSWSLADITGQKFYEFSDVKPGDQGKNAISFHVYGNNGWACLSLENKQDNENVCNDPELAVPDTSCTDPDAGELSQYINMFAWRDDKDGIYEPLQGETQVYNGSIGSLLVPVADSTTGGPLVASNDKWIGLAWCAGTLNVNGWGGMTCDGSTMSDITQTDQLVADVTAYTEQFRNNPNFRCADLNK